MISASEARAISNEIQKKENEKFSRELLSLLDTKIREAANSGHDFFRFDLSIKDFERAGSVITALTDEGFDYEYEEETGIFVISWN